MKFFNKLKNISGCDDNGHRHGYYQQYITITISNKSFYVHGNLSGYHELRISDTLHLKFHT